MHTQSSPKTHTYVHTHTHTHTHTGLPTYTGTHRYTHIHTCLSTNTHTHTHTHMIHTRMRTQPQAAEPSLVAACQGRPPTPLRGSQRLQLGGRNPTLLHQPAARSGAGQGHPPCGRRARGPQPRGSLRLLTCLCCSSAGFPGVGADEGLPGRPGKPREVRLVPRTGPAGQLAWTRPLLLSTHPDAGRCPGPLSSPSPQPGAVIIAKEAAGPSWGALGSPGQPAARVSGGAAAFPGSSRGAGGPDPCHSWTLTSPLLRRGAPFWTIPPCPGPSPPTCPRPLGGSPGSWSGWPAPPICGRQRLPWAPWGPSCFPSGAWATAAPRCPRRGSSRSPGAGRCTPRRACSHCPTCPSRTAYRGHAGCRGCGAGGGTDTANSSPS